MLVPSVHVLKVKYLNIKVINYENLNITKNTAHNKYALIISHKIDDEVLG